MERPILFSASMIRAIIAGQKTVTRRVVNVDRLKVHVPEFIAAEMAFVFGDTSVKPGTYPATMNAHGAVSVLRDGRSIGVKPGEFQWVSPYGTPGEALWLRETWRTATLPDGLNGIRFRADDTFVPIANTLEASVLWGHAQRGAAWRPSIFMPRWASRLSLRVADVRVERLQDITEEDARAEGVTPLQMDGGSCLPRFEGLWDTINGKRAPWASNPWVWRVAFERVTTGGAGR